MLQIRIGPDPNVNRASVIGAICAQAEAGVRKQILLVPEQFSHRAEYALCRRGGSAICLSAEVLSFTRLAARVFSLCGGVCRQVLDPGGRLLAMRQAVQLLESRLKLYASHLRKTEFLLRLLAVVDELQHECITPAMLRTAAQKSQGQFAVKLEELALIFESYLTVLSADEIDEGLQLELLHKSLLEEDLTAEYTFYVCGFTDFTRQELSILQVLLQKCKAMTVSFLCPQERTGLAFERTWDTVGFLKKEAKKLQVPVQVLQELPSQEKAPSLLVLQQKILGASGEDHFDADGIKVFQYGSVQEECLWVTGKILELLRGGCRLGEIAVVAANAAAYLPQLKACFDQYRLPAYFSGSDPILSSPVMQTVLSALRAACLGMEREDVLNYLKSGLSCLPWEDCDLIENYAVVWNIHASRWEQEWTLHPAGMDRELDEDAKARLVRLNGARRQAVAPLCRLKDRLEAEETVGQKVLALWDFITQIALDRRLQQQAEHLEQTGRLQKAQQQRQLFAILCQALEQMHRVLQDVASTPEEFFRLCTALLAQYEVGTIPAALDTIAVGDVMSMRDCACRHLFVLGAEEGSFPDYRADTGLLTQEDREQLQRLGLAVTQDSDAKMEREFAAIYQVLSAPSETVCFSFCGEQPSHLLRRVCALFSLPPERGTPISSCYFYQPDRLGALLARKKNDDYAQRLGADVQAAFDRLETKAGYTVGRLEKTSVEKLYGKTLYLSASRIDKYAACRFSYFLDYGLKAKPVKPAKFDAPIYGTFVHSVLEHTVEQVMKEGGFAAVSQERLGQIAQAHMASFVKTQLHSYEKTDRAQKLLERSYQEIQAVVENLAQELAQSKFQPVRQELEFSETGEIPPIFCQAQNGASQISGFVDRVDLFTDRGRTYVRVVDYKTGKKSFDYTDVLNGIGLQMLIYLFALKKYGRELFGRELEAGGVLYVPARVPVLSSPTKLSPEGAQQKRLTEFQRKGLVLEEKAVLEAMERNFESGTRFMPFRLDAKGNLIGDVASPDQMELLEQYVTGVIASMTDRIFQGDIEPDPIFRGKDQGVCSYCEFTQVCHLHSDVQVRMMEKTDRDEFWQRVERQVKAHGESKAD